MNNRVLNFKLDQIPSPCFVLDEKLLIKNLELLQQIQDEACISILCALKGFAMWSTFPLLKKHLSGITASSLHEAQLCYEEFGSKAHLCAPVYVPEEFDRITNFGDHITFNSIQQFEKFGTLAVKKGLDIALRINPEYSEIETDIYNPCVPGSRLGIVADDLPEQLPEQVSGLHFHTLCAQNSDTLERTLHAVEEKFQQHLKQVSWLNIGGGHHFTRADYNVDHFIDIIVDFKNRYNLRIIAEPGEAIGWQTGYLVATVQDIVKSNGIRTAMLDTSFAAHMPDCLEMPYMPSVFGASDCGDSEFKYRLGGNTCLAGEYMGDYFFKAPLVIGDKIVFDDMIHYTMVKTNTFNGVKLPSIGKIDIDRQFQLIKSFGYRDFKGRLS